jgi:hypothetical protein
MEKKSLLGWNVRLVLQLEQCSENVSTEIISHAFTTQVQMQVVLLVVLVLLHVHVDSSHEAIQRLHQAYVCSFEYVLLLVGGATGERHHSRCVETLLHLLLSSHFSRYLLLSLYFIQ